MKIDPKIKQSLRNFLKKKLEEEREMIFVISPYKLEKDDLKLLEERFLFLKDRKIKNVVDPNLLGGVIIKKGTEVIDLSLNSKLQSLKKILYGNDR